jgi:acylphosphatase
MQQKARELGLCGFVKNLPDGSVYAEAEGDAALLDALADWCRRGPEGTKVERVEVSEGAWCGFEKFEVVR